MGTLAVVTLGTALILFVSALPQPGITSAGRSHHGHHAEGGGGLGVTLGHQSQEKSRRRNRGGGSGQEEDGAETGGLVVGGGDGGDALNLGTSNRRGRGRGKSGGGLGSGGLGHRGRSRRQGLSFYSAQQSITQVSGALIGYGSLAVIFSDRQSANMIKGLSRFTEPANDFRSIIIVYWRIIYACRGVLNTWIPNLGDFFQDVLVLMWRFILCGDGTLRARDNSEGPFEICSSDYGSEYGWRTHDGVYTEQGLRAFYLRVSYEEQMKTFFQDGSEYKSGTPNVIYNVFLELERILSKDFATWTQQDVVNIWAQSCIVFFAIVRSYQEPFGRMASNGMLHYGSVVAQKYQIDLEEVNQQMNQALSGCTRYNFGGGSTSGKIVIRTDEKRGLKFYDDGSFIFKEKHRKYAKKVAKCGRRAKNVDEMTDAMIQMTRLERSLLNDLWPKQNLGNILYNMERGFVAALLCLKTDNNKKIYQSKGWKPPRICKKYQFSSTDEVYAHYKVKDCQSEVQTKKQAVNGGQGFKHNNEKALFESIEYFTSFFSKDSSEWTEEYIWRTFVIPIKIQGIFGNSYNKNLGEPIIRAWIEYIRPVTSRQFQVDWSVYTSELITDISRIEQYDYDGHASTNDNVNIVSSDRNDQRKSSASQSADVSSSTTVTQTGTKEKTEQKESESDIDTKNNNSSNDNNNNEYDEGDEDDEDDGEDEYWVYHEDQQEDDRRNSQVTSGQTSSSNVQSSNDGSTTNSATNTNRNDDNIDADDEKDSYESFEDYEKNDEIKSNTESDEKSERKKSKNDGENTRDEKNGTKKNKKGSESNEENESNFEIKRKTKNDTDRDRKNKKNRQSNIESDESNDFVKRRKTKRTSTEVETVNKEDKTIANKKKKKNNDNSDESDTENDSHSRRKRRKNTRDNEEDEGCGRGKKQTRSDQGQVLSSLEPFYKAMKTTSNLKNIIKNLRKLPRPASTFNEVFEFLTKIARAISGILNSLYCGYKLGDRYTNLVLALLRPACCASNGPIARIYKSNDWDKSSMCDRFAGKRWGLKKYEGHTYSLVDAVKFYKTREIKVKLEEAKKSLDDDQVTENLIVNEMIKLYSFTEKDIGDWSDDDIMDIIGHFLGIFGAVASGYNPQNGRDVVLGSYTYIEVLKSSYERFTEFETRSKSTVSKCTKFRQRDSSDNDSGGDDFENEKDAPQSRSRNKKGGNRSDRKSERKAKEKSEIEQSEIESERSSTTNRDRTSESKRGKIDSSHEITDDDDDIGYRKKSKNNSRLSSRSDTSNSVSKANEHSSSLTKTKSGKTKKYHDGSESNDSEDDEENDGSEGRGHGNRKSTAGREGNRGSKYEYSEDEGSRVRKSESGNEFEEEHLKERRSQNKYSEDRSLSGGQSGQKGSGGKHGGHGSIGGNSGGGGSNGGTSRGGGSTGGNSGGGGSNSGNSGGKSQGGKQSGGESSSNSNSGGSGKNGASQRSVRQDSASQSQGGFEQSQNSAKYQPDESGNFAAEKHQQASAGQEEHAQQNTYARKDTTKSDGSRSSEQKAQSISQDAAAQKTSTRDDSVTSNNGQTVEQRSASDTSAQATHQEQAETENKETVGADGSTQSFSSLSSSALQQSSSSSNSNSTTIVEES